ncbi:MAG: T9SS C-terminal target domain-containing protein [Calditrichaeota bacterium]|nr:MAG: T9SS C-terminal target domain-containing protein [Calditrichota bacterium]
MDVDLKIYANDNNLVFTANEKIKPIGLRDSVLIAWSGKNRRGVYKVVANTNAQNSIAEVRTDNNSASREIYFYSSSLTIAEPRSLTQLSEPEPTLVVYNPELAAGENAYYEFEIDTSQDFSSPFLVRSGSIDEQDIRTGWKVSRTLGDGLYFWRCRRNTVSSQSPWENAAFWINKNEASWAYRQEKAFWPQSGATYNTLQDGISLPYNAAKTRLLQVRSLGESNGNGYCDLIIDGTKINTTNDLPGHNLMAIDPVTQNIIGVPYSFNTSVSTTAADSMANLLQNLPERTILAIGIHDDGSVAMTGNALDALSVFGSTQASQVGLYDSWSMIGTKGATADFIKEQFVANNQGTAIVSDTLQQFLQNGEISSGLIGPALSWGHLRFTQNLVRLIPGIDAIQDVRIVVQGQRKAQSGMMNLSEFSGGGEYDLSGISSEEYPYLQLKAYLSDDDGLDSPVLQNWSVSYEPAGDIALDPKSIQLSGDSLLAGELLNVSMHIYSFGKFLADSVNLSLLQLNYATNPVFISSKTIKIPNDDHTEIQFDFHLSSQGNNRLKLVADVNDEIPESHEQNNGYEFVVFAKRDDAPPTLDVLVDGNEVLEDDYVALNPRIVCNVFDESPGAIQDTSHFIIQLDGQRVYFSDVQSELSFALVGDGMQRAKLVYEPELSPGKHVFAVQVTDAFGYRNEVIQRLNVAENFAIYNVLNYPNPFRAETNFTFYLTRQAQSVHIKIFTISGKLIQVLDLYTPEIGFNRIYWDGLDRDNDTLANGIYLYKVIAKQRDKTAEFIGKVAIAR